MALAMKAGYVSPRKMLGEMSLRELGTWAALWQIDPWDEQRDDFRAGMVASVVAGVAMKKSFRPVDFMPYSKLDTDAVSRDVSTRLRAALKARG